MSASSSKLYLHLDWKDYDLPTQDPQDAIRSIAAEKLQIDKLQGRQYFNDLEYLQGLQQVFQSVRLVRVVVYHNHFIMGVRAVYNCQDVDGNDVECVGEQHNFRQGYYVQQGGTRRTSILTLSQDEYICAVRTRQGDITDSVTFVTNQRQASFGGNGGSEEPHDGTVELSRRVVAFCGTSQGVLHRLGYIAESINWEILKPVILLRKLIQTGRAEQTTPVKNCTKEQLYLHAVLQDTEEHLFRHFLSFVAPTDHT